MSFNQQFEYGRAQIDVRLEATRHGAGTAKKDDGEVFEFDEDAAWSPVFLIELKPSLGDDFPAVLRQARAKECGTVVFETFAATTVTLEQIRAMFAPIRLVSIAEISEA